MNTEVYNRYELNPPSRSSQLRVGVIGMGNMGIAIINGLTCNDAFAGKVFVCNRTREETISKLNLDDMKGNIQIAKDNRSVIRSSNMLFISLKQAQMREEFLTWKETGEILDNKLIVSFAAGIRISTIKKWLGNEKQPVVRVMPNTPAAVGQGVFGWTVSDEITVGQMRQLKKLFSSLGSEVYVELESDIDIVTALSGSGPAYFYLQAEKMIQTAMEMGLDAKQAEIAGRHAFIGAAALLIAHPNVDLATLRKNITSKGGTTEAALQRFTELGFDKTIREAMNAAKNRANELGKMFDDV